MLRRERRGFTLVEILLVVVILGVLAAMVIPNLAGRGEEARRTAAMTDIEANLSSALDLYELDVGRYPTTEQGLLALVERPSAVTRWKGPYLKKKKLPVDPWGRGYQYVSPGVNNTDGYDLSSLGPDGEVGPDDITNWTADVSGR